MAVPVSHIDAERFADLIIVGSGPAALALAVRLSESAPAALYTDAEHARLAWLRQRSPGGCRIRKRQPRLVNKAAPPTPDRGTIIALNDSSDRWLDRWRTGFDQLGIASLRSPLHFHPGADDVDVRSRRKHTI